MLSEIQASGTPEKPAVSPTSEKVSRAGRRRSRCAEKSTFRVSIPLTSERIVPRRSYATLLGAHGYRERERAFWTPGGARALPELSTDPSLFYSIQIPSLLAMLGAPGRKAPSLAPLGGGPAGSPGVRGRGTRAWQGVFFLIARCPCGCPDPPPSSEDLFRFFREGHSVQSMSGTTTSFPLARTRVKERAGVRDDER